MTGGILAYSRKAGMFVQAGIVIFRNGLSLVSVAKAELRRNDAISQQELVSRSHKGERMIVGMDFGTTHSGMAVYDGQALRSIPLNVLEPNDRVTPTILYLTNEQKVTFGREAINAYFAQNLGRPSKLEKVWVGEITQTFAELPTFVRDVYIWVDVLSPGRLFLSFKTDLSDSSYAGTAIGRFFYTLEDIAALYLYIAKRRAERILGHELEEIVLGRPVRFHDNPEADTLAQARLLDAALQAGYRRVYFQPEPIAAAHYYETTITRPENVLVFDFGGGTLDMTIMRLGDSRQRQVLATGGVPLAGDVFDRKIVRAKIPKLFGEGSLYRSLNKRLPLPGWIFDAFGDWRTLLNLQTPEQMEVLRTIAPNAEKRQALQALIRLVTSNYSLKLYEVVEQVKRRLSEQRDAVIRLQGDGFLIREPITRSEFEQLIRPEYNIIARHLDETLHASGLRADQIDVVIRTGGSSQIPLFQGLLAQKFGEEKVKAIDTFGSVTAGLGVIGQRIARGELEAHGYTHSSKLAPSTASERAHIPPINLNLLKQQIDWQERGEAEQISGNWGLLLLSKNYELGVVEQPAHLLQATSPLPLAATGLPLHTPAQLVLAARLDEPILLLTSLYRLLLVTLRELLQQHTNGVELAHLQGFGRGEQLCWLCRWAPIRDHSQLLLVSTQGYARKFEMVQMRPSIEGPTPTKLDWNLPGWPRLVVGAEAGQQLVLVSSSGRGVRWPMDEVRRTGLRLFHKAKADELIGGWAGDERSEAWLLSSSGYASWLQAGQIPLTTTNSQGALVVRRRGALCAVVPSAVNGLWAVTTSRLLSLNPSATPSPTDDPLAMHKACTLAVGEGVLGVLAG
jgi:hypothetical chaperone protein